MSYSIPKSADDAFVDQEFDYLDWRIREGYLDEVRESCFRILEAPDASVCNASWANLLLGTVDLARENYAGALQHLNAIEKFAAPLRSRLIASTAKALVMLGRIAEARQYIQALLVESPQSWHTWEVVGLSKKAEGDEDGAWRSLLRAAECNSREPSIMSSLIALGLTPARYRELALALERYLALEPYAMGFRVCLVSCFVSMGDIQRAHAEASRVVAFGPFAELPEDLLVSMRQLLHQLEQV